MPAGLETIAGISVFDGVWLNVCNGNKQDIEQHSAELTTASQR